MTKKNLSALFISQFKDFAENISLYQMFLKGSTVLITTTACLACISSKFYHTLAPSSEGGAECVLFSRTCVPTRRRVLCHTCTICYAHMPIQEHTWFKLA